MSDPSGTAITDDLDDLRLFALGRIPRCMGCQRRRALEDAHAGRRAGILPLPPPPPHCFHQVCAPIAARLTRPKPRAGPRRVADGVWASNG